MQRGEATVGQRIAVDPPWSNLNIPAHLGTVEAIKDGGETLVVRYDGRTSTSTIAPRIARQLKDGES